MCVCVCVCVCVMNIYIDKYNAYWIIFMRLLLVYLVLYGNIY